MAEETFYMRVRGRVSGPFDILALQKLVRRGTLSRIHEISNDRVSWSAAGEFEDLFPSHQVPVAALEPEVALEDVGEEPPDVFEPKPAGASLQGGILYYYTQRGSTVGPVPLSVLKVLVENETLRPDDLVWRENADTGAPAAQMPALAPMFGGLAAGTKLGYAGRDHRRLDRGQSSALQSALTSAAAQARLTGIGAGVGILVILNLPWFTINKKPVWWWDLYQEPAANAWATFATFIVVAAAALCVVAPLLKGVARGVVFLSLTVATWIFLSVAMVVSEVPGNVVVSLAFPLALALMLGVCLFREVAPESGAGRTLLGIGSGIVMLGMLMGTINSFRQAGPYTNVPGGIVFGAVLVFAGLLAGLTAGVTGFVGLKSTFTPALNKATAFGCAAALLLPSVGILIAMASASTFFDSSFSEMGLSSVENREFNHVMIEITGRLLLVIFASLSVVVAGIRELLTAAHASAYAK